MTLPEGMLLNPSAANGLEACSRHRSAIEGQAAERPARRPGSAEPLRFSTEPAACPDASKLGTVRIKTPLLWKNSTGSVYLAQPRNAEPVRLADRPLHRRRKRKARAARQARRRRQAQRSDRPDLDHLQGHPAGPLRRPQRELFGGPRGPLTTPATCGTYATTASLHSRGRARRAVDLSAAGLPRSPPAPAARRAPSPLPFAPTSQAGSSNLQAGAFTPFTLTIGHPDGDQPLSALTMHLPRGIAAMLSSVTPCPEPTGSE